MLGDMLRKGLGLEQEMQGFNPMQQSIPIGLQGALMAGSQGFDMSPQRPDMFGQYNNLMMFSRRI